MRILLAIMLMLFLATWAIAGVCCCRCQRQKTTTNTPTQTFTILPADEEKAKAWKMKFEYWKSSKNGEWYWHGKSRNGRITGDSGEGYKNKMDCLKDIESYKLQGPSAEVVEIQEK